MKFCLPHWNKLRHAIEARGLTPLISDGGASAMQKMIKDDGRSLEHFDPLMSAHNMIVGHALNAGGLAVLAPNDGSDKCPICYLTAEHTRQCTDAACGQDFEKWIDCAADGVKRHVDELMKRHALMDPVDPCIPLELLPPGCRAYVLAEHQTKDYLPLPSVRTPDGKVITRWRPTPEELQLLLAGRDLYLITWTFHQLFQPVAMTVGPPDLRETLPA